MYLLIIGKYIPTSMYLLVQRHCMMPTNVLMHILPSTAHINERLVQCIFNLLTVTDTIMQSGTKRKVLELVRRFAVKKDLDDIKSGRMDTLDRHLKKLKTLLHHRYLWR